MRAKGGVWEVHLYGRFVWERCRREIGGRVVWNPDLYE